MDVPRDSKTVWVLMTLFFFVIDGWSHWQWEGAAQNMSLGHSRVLWHLWHFYVDFCSSTVTSQTDFSKIPLSEV